MTSLSTNTRPRRRRCLSCTARITAAYGPLCASCREIEDQRHRAERWAELRGLWVLIAVGDAFLGLLVGVVALFGPDLMPLEQWQARDLNPIPALVLLGIIVALIGTAHRVLFSPLVKRPRLWGAVAGAEVLLVALCSLCWALAVGPVVGLTTVSCACAGMVIALAQTYLLRRQTPEASAWIIISAGARGPACVAALGVELWLPHPVVGPIWSVVVGRLVYDALAVPGLTLLLARADSPTRAGTRYPP